MGIKDGDDVDFLKFKDNYFIFAKKSDIVGSVVGQRPAISHVAISAPAPVSASGPEPFSFIGEVDADELKLLKKLDTIRYSDRTRTKINSMLDAGEKAVLQKLLKRRAVTLFQKSPDQEAKYGISKGVYNKYLFGKREGVTQQPAGVPAKAEPYLITEASRPQPKRWEVPIKGGPDTYVSQLETAGYLVLANEADASALSASLEDSIKRGAVLGTRAFNRKFYVVLRSFMTRNAPKVIRALEKKSMGISEIAKTCEIDEDAARAILYMMSESGEISEVKRDIFRLV